MLSLFACSSLLNVLELSTAFVKLFVLSFLSSKNIDDGL